MTKKARFKNSIKDIGQFDSFIMGVSMGSKNHTGDAFNAIVDCVNESHSILGGILDVSDSLKRYTLMLDVSDEQAHEQANEKGQQWLAQNTDAIKKFNIPVHVKHWDTWLEDESFPKYLAQFEAAYENCEELCEAIAKDINNFYCRRFNDATNNPEAFALSVRFYLEELAVMSIQFEDNNAAHIYAGKELNCLKLVRSGKVPDVPTGIQSSKFYRLNIYDVPDEDDQSGEEVDTLFPVEGIAHG